MKMGGHPGKQRGGKRSDGRVKTSVVEGIGDENGGTSGKAKRWERCDGRVKTSAVEGIGDENGGTSGQVKRWEMKRAHRLEGQEREQAGVERREGHSVHFTSIRSQFASKVGGQSEN